MMNHSAITSLALAIVFFGSLATGRVLQQKDAETHSDRTAEAIIQAHDVVNAALSNADAEPARTKSLVYARLATRDTTEPWMADGSTGARKLLQHQVSSRSYSIAAARKLQQQHESNERGDRISWSLSATHDVIAQAVEAGADLGATRSATAAGLYNARLTTRDNEPWQFDSGDRK